MIFMKLPRIGKWSKAKCHLYVAGRTAAVIFAHTLLILESNEKWLKINSQNEYDSKFTFFEYK